MGIQHLNQYLMTTCKSNRSIQKIGFSDLYQKTLVFDTSIYLYRFKGSTTTTLAVTPIKPLIENFYLLFTLLKKYAICPIFVFDGKPPPEKWGEIGRRQTAKMEAKTRYLSLSSVKNNTTKEEERSLNQLKNQFIQITNKEIREVKKLMDAFGYHYIQAEGEADPVCASIVLSGTAWACFSDDMDMFIHGCPFVIRSLSLANQTMVLYDRQSILLDLGLTDQEFCQILILSGTDYNQALTNQSLFLTIDWFNRYKSVKDEEKEEEKELMNDYSPCFYSWLQKNTDYIKDMDQLINTYRLFLPFTGKHTIENPCSMFDPHKIRDLMTAEGFVYL
jgi:5'-3' exonuclease